jgi:hypothetical protein
MDERGANIDVVFRNGLKDYEVLPPPEVWDNIHPVVKTNLRPLLILRTAAAVAVLMSVSFLAYRLTREIPSEIINNVSALDVATIPAIIKHDPVVSVSENRKRNNLLLISRNDAVANSGTIFEPVADEVITSPDIALIQKSGSLSPENSRLLKGPNIPSVNLTQNTAFQTEDFTDLYIQDDNLKKNSERWSIAALATPTYNSSFNSGKDELSKQLDASEQNIVSYSGGVAFSFKVNRRFSVQSGLFYSSVGQMIDGINSFGGFQKYDNTKGDRNFEVLTSSGTIYTNNGDVFLLADGPAERISTSFTNDVFDPVKASLQYINNNLRQNFSYLELPVILRYKFVDKTVDLNLIGGLSYNLLVDNSVYTIVDGIKYSVGKTEGLNSVSISSSLGMGMEYNISDKLSLNLEPTFRYYINRFNQLTGSNVHPYSFGIFSGISYKF